MRTQVAIVGGGPAGSTSALYLGERGIDAILIEEEFPRFHVGESMTGWAAERVRALGLAGKMQDYRLDLMDSFWANPLGWGYLLHFTDHRSDILDIFGGKIYDEEPLAGLVAPRKLKAAGRSRLPVPVG